MKSIWIVSGLFLGGAAGAFAHVNDRGMDYESYKNSPRGFLLWEPRL